MREFSTNALNAMNAIDGSGDVFLWVMSITHESIDDINVVNNNVDVVSNGVTYTAYAFSITLSDDRVGQIPELKLSIDNVDRMLVDEIRTLGSPMTVDIKLILASSPDLIEMEFPAMTLRRVSYNALTISGSLVVSEMLSVRFPKGKITATNYAGLF